MIDDERCLVGAAGSGDAAAFGELLARCRTSALRVATVVLGTAVGADDVVQDASVRAWQAIGDVDPERGFRPWFLRVVANTARNGRRSRGRRAALAVRAGAEPVVPDAGPEERAVSNRERDVVLAAVNRLGAQDRLVVTLRYFEQLSEAEMTVVLSCAPGTVKSRLSRAMTRLRAELDREGGVGA